MSTSVLPSRRAIAKGVAWSVPVATVASAAPAWAVSCTNRTTLPFTAGGCTGSTSLGCGSSFTNPQSASSQWQNFTWPDGVSRRTFVMWSDSQSVSTKKTISTTFTFAATAGKPYTITFYLMAGQGYVANGGTCNTWNSDLAISGPAGTITSYSTTSGAAGPNFLIPGDSCTNGGVRDAAATRRTTTTTYTATPTTSGTVTITMSFSMAATDGGNNDDWWVAPVIAECS